LRTSGQSNFTIYIFDPHVDALQRVLVRERPDNSLTYCVYGIGLLYESAISTGAAMQGTSSFIRNQFSTGGGGGWK